MTKIREGYKETEIGVIPEDWEVTKLKELAEICYGKNQKNVLDENGKYKILGTGGLMGYANNYLWDKPSVLIGRKGTINKPMFINEPFWTVDTLFYTKISEDTEAKWLYFYLNYIDLAKFNEATGVPSLNTTTLNNINIITPPKVEQKRIVEVLSSTESHIEKLDKTIEDYQLLKKGMMKKLLTEGIGHTEFKETEIGRIPKAWEVDSFENICVPKGLVRGPFGGALKKEYFVQNGYKVYEQKNAINRDAFIGEYYVDKDKFDELKRFEVKSKDFIVSCSGTIGRIYQIPENHEKGIINQALLKITTNSDIINDLFFFYYFEWDSFQKKIIDNTQGGAMKNLVGMEIIKKTPFCIPPLSEQKRIAEILTGIDDIIYGLDNERLEFVQLKKSLMEKLLTGKIRVV